MPDKYELFLDKNKKVKLSADEQGNFFAEANDKKIKLGASGLENVDESGVASPVGADLTALDQSIIPDTNEVYDLGSAEKKFRDLYLSSNSIFIGDTKISSDPTTGALSTAVADEQGQFTTPATPVGGAASFYDWRGSTKNIAIDDPINTTGELTRFSMESLYANMVLPTGSNSQNTGLFQVFWGNYFGNPNTSKTTAWNGYSISSGPYDPYSTFISDENGDDLSAFLANKMEEENLPIVNFEFTLSAKLQVQDPVKAAYIPYFQQGQFNNLTNVTSVPLWTMTQHFMYAFKTADTGSYGNKNGLQIGTMGRIDEYDYNFRDGADKLALYNLGTGANTFNQDSVFQFNSMQAIYSGWWEDLCLDIDMRLNTPSVNMQSSDLINANVPSDLEGYFDLQDGIVFDMLVKLK